MKTTRFRILAALLVSLYTSGMISSQLQEKLSDDFVETYGQGMNAPCYDPAMPSVYQRKTSSKQLRSYAKFEVGTGGYIAANIGKGSAIQELVNSDLKKKLGVTNLQYQLPIGEVLLFDRIVIEHATATAGTEVDKVTGWSKDLPDEIKNGEIEISTAGKVVFSGAIDAINDYQNNADKPYFQLFDPRYLLDGQTWQVVIKQPVQFSDDQDHYVKVRLEGAKTYIG
ncbi:MAG: hypothetical protein GXO49_04105 [Chlorobi bacterium]|nr:hypothetical protein [Chlorobiota bacterium]